ncbi:hypothetical protein [Planotetraspora sp. GP83]|uniref:hypothetical protein n=1 Tax=Planotetraspora sp. GP83 TaxID=3156264 RepID=UPI0035126551
MTATPVRLSTVVMHHPARAALLDTLLSSCARLAPRVVLDPRPGDFPSPLRTAKVAWAAVGEDATHHLVLQDDVRLADEFAAQLLEVLARRPDRALTLYTSWHTGQNSYLVRLATVLGAPLAPLSAREWTPTLGLVLPAAQARELAAFLAEFPDEVRDDDWLVLTFLRRFGRPVLATVPHLVDHTESGTLAGHPGRFHATLFQGDRPVPRTHWTSAAELEHALTERAALRGPRAFTVELTGSRCLLRLLSPDRGEPVEHTFGWYWHDWCHLVGADPDRIADAFDRHRRTAGDPPAGEMWPAVEVWAAGYLLGADAAAVARGLPKHDPPDSSTGDTRTNDTSTGDGNTGDTSTGDASRAGFVRRALVTWIRSGMRDSDLARLGDAGLRALTEVGVAAVAAGARDPLERVE